MNSQTRRRTGKRLLVCLFMLLTMVAAEASAYAGTVRGMLVRRDAYRRSYVAPYVGVTLNHPQRGRSSVVYSGTDGMYYLYNVPPGDYYLEVWVARNKSVVYTITVSNRDYTDISPIEIP